MRTLAQLMDLSGRTALLAGGAGHIARAAGEALVELGARVAIVDVDHAACRARADLFNQTRSGSAVAVQCDLSDEQATRHAAREAVDALGGLDILLHCAAAVAATPMDGWAVPFPQQTVAAWDRALRINLTSAFVLAQETRAALMQNARGSIVLFSSIYGVVGPDDRLYEGTAMANPFAYGASKAGVLQLMRYLTTTLAPQVRVNTISPGGVLRGQPDSFQQRYVARTPLQRMAVEEDLKGAVAYFASDLSAYVTGQNLLVDGGWTAW